MLILIGVSNCYWLIGTADRGIGEAVGVTDNTVGKTEAELKSLATTLGDKFVQFFFVYGKKGYCLSSLLIFKTKRY